MESHIQGKLAVFLFVFYHFYSFLTLFFNGRGVPHVRLVSLFDMLQTILSAIIGWAPAIARIVISFGTTLVRDNIFFFFFFINNFCYNV